MKRTKNYLENSGYDPLFSHCKCDVSPTITNSPNLTDLFY